MKKEVKICDVCEKNVATRVCLTCDKDLCGDENCSARSYFDKYIPYELDKDFDFCKDCSKSFGYLTRDELREWFGGVVGNYNYSDMVSGWLSGELRTAKDNIKSVATEKFRSAILKSQDAYKEKIAKEKREKEIKDEIEKLNKQKQELESKML